MEETDRERMALRVFSEICELLEPQQSAMLDQRCASDPELRQRVEALLKADSATLEPLAPQAVDGFLQTEIGQVANVAMKPRPSPNEALPTDYRLLRVLGEGGMATVYEAEQQHPRRMVAVKIVRSASFSPELRQRFDYEAQVLARLQHPNIAQLYEADTRPEGASVCAYLAMELVRGVPIDEYVENNKLNLQPRVELLLRVCDAVEYAHRMGVMHRDLKPANILVQEDGQPKILDFGVARAIERDERLCTVLTHAGEVIGTLPYMSPEQVDGNQSPDTRADVYALGVLLYKLLTGKLPVNVSNCGIAEAARRICQEVPALPSHFDRGLRGDLDVIVSKALEKDPERRYRSVQSLASDLRRFLDGRAIEARGGSSFYVLRKTIWRFRRIAAVAGAFLAVILAFAIYAEIQARHNKELAYQAAESRDAAVRNAEQLRRSLYLSNIGFAQAALETNDIGHVFPLLNGCPPDLRGWEWNYLRSLSDRSENTWTTDARLPRAIDMSSDCSRIALGTDSAVAVSDGPDRKVSFTRKFSDGDVAVALSRDGRYLACGPWIDEMSLIDLSSGKELWITPPTTRPAYAMLRRLRTLQFSSDGKTLAAAGYDGHIRIRDIASASVRRDIDAKCLSILCMTFANDNHSLIGGDDHGRLRMWNVDDGSMLRDSTPHDGAIGCVALNVDGTVLGSGGSDSKIILRKVEDFSEIKTLSAGRPIIWSVAFSPDDTELAAGSDDNLIRLWKLNENGPAKLLRGHADTIHCVSFEPGRHALLSAATDANIKRWNLDRIDPTNTISMGDVATYTTCFLQHGSGMLIACNDGTVRCWDRTAGKECWRYTGPRTTLRGLALDTLHSRVAVCGDDNIVRILDLADGHTLQMLEVDAGQIGAVEFSLDGKRLVTGDSGGLLRIWNVESLPARAVVSIPAHKSIIMSLAMHLDGVHFASGGVDGYVKLWAVDKTVPLAEARPTGATVRDLCFDSSGSWLATGHSDGAIWILDGRTLASLHELRGHQGAVNGLAFQPGTSRLASGGVDRTVRLWDVTSAAQILTLRGQRRPIEHLAFTPDGVTLASTSLDGTVELWDSQGGGSNRTP